MGLTQSREDVDNANAASRVVGTKLQPPRISGLTTLKAASDFRPGRRAIHYRKNDLSGT